jgi:acyl CoA:acetate/3-ketoacid CoA transferase
VKAKIVSFEQAAAAIPDGAAVSICGAWMLVPDRTLQVVAERFQSCGHPRDITAIFPICPGGVPSQPGIDRLAHQGLLRRLIGGSYPNAASALRKLMDANQVEAYNLPTGMVLGGLRAAAGGRVGFLTETGIGTFVDPRQGGGRMNAAALDDLLSVVEIQGRRHLFLPALRTDVAIIRATTADENGNLSMEAESATLSAFVQAAAARASGGKVIAQVQRVVPSGTLKAHAVKVPGTLVDMIVIDPGQAQTTLTAYDPALCGEQMRALDSFDPLAGPDRIIAARACREIRRDDVVVLGYGISAHVPHLLGAQGRLADATFAVEQGSLGGLPLTGSGFGNSLNPQAILDAAIQFDLFSGGCFDVAMLSFLQADAQGRINVHKIASRPHLSVGIGGFLDIAAAAPRLLILGYFTAGGLQVEANANGVRIVREGTMRKFVSRVDEVSFDPAYGRAKEVLFITERAVLRFDGAWHVEEAAPGIDVDSEILARMDFPADTRRIRFQEAVAGSSAALS